MAEFVAVRVWGSVDAFRLACPGCQRIIAVRQDHRSLPNRRQASNRMAKVEGKAYDQLSQTVQCPYCQKVMGIGLLVYDKGISGQRGRQRPADVKPTKRELIQLRNQHGGGWWSTEKHTSDDPVNKLVTELDLPERTGEP